MKPGELLEEDEQPRGGCFIFMAPIVFLSVLIGGYALVFALGSKGRAPTGDRVAMHFDLSCPAAADGIQARVSAMGLGDPVFEASADKLVVTARLPANPDDAASIPSTLATRGVFTVRDPNGEVLATHSNIATSAVRLDFSATPSVVLQLDKPGAIALETAMKGAPSSAVTLHFDDRQVDQRKNTPVEDDGKLQLEPQHERLDGVTRLAAAWALWLDSGPLACDAAVSKLTIVEPAP